MTVFSHAQTVVLCVGCSTVLCQPTGGKARLTEGSDLVWRICGYLTIYYNVTFLQDAPSDENNIKIWDWTKLSYIEICLNIIKKVCKKKCCDICKPSFEKNGFCWGLWRLRCVGGKVFCCGAAVCGISRLQL